MIPAGVDRQATQRPVRDNKNTKGTQMAAEKSLQIVWSTAGRQIV